jgi:transposase
VSFPAVTSGWFRAATSRSGRGSSCHRHPLPDRSREHTELRRRGVMLLLLWEEYRAEHPDGYGYSRFCALYGA